MTYSEAHLLLPPLVPARGCPQAHTGWEAMAKESLHNSVRQFHLFLKHN